ncbi:MAG: peptidoglycan glycosyltransferase [Spirochaetae bacterium HGW-Spirochaetae-3]|nr:MAG: peptidoglycan glycosyltransferase [Spirochaetae bacterium HGW-Spirochaetae-3]
MSSSPDRRRARLRAAALRIGAVAALYLLCFRIAPRLSPYAGQAALDSLRFSVVVLDADGGELQALPVGDGLRRLYVPAASAPPELERLVLRAEDRRFRLHPGVDALALLRAAAQNAGDGRTVSGASTLSMQVARLLSPRPRTMGAKIAEAWEALQLESRVGKSGILDLYLNLIPFGRNVEGFGAAARVYFGASLDRLTRAQLMVLCVIPRAPARYDPAESPEAARDATLRLAAAMGDDPARAAEATDEALSSALDGSRGGVWPFRAPHYLAYLRSSGALDGIDGKEPFRTAIEPALQSWLEDLAARTVDEARAKRVTNAAALFVRPSDMRVAAWVGSVDFHDAEGAGQVDGVTMRRQPGSTLKPFLYALALESGWDASTVIPDVPTDFGGAEVYVPANFNNQFNGPVRLRQALASSLNIPAVYTLERIGVEPFANFLVADGFRSIDEQRGSLGLGLALGNAEISLFELVRAYGLFMNDGIPAALNDGGGLSPYAADEKAIVDPRVAALVRDILTRHPDRTLAFGRGGHGRLKFDGAIKTGTSNQFNNIWAVGFTSDLLGGVWMGNFSGSTVVGTADSGYPAAMLSSTLEAFSSHEPFPPLSGLEKRRVCALSGMAATDACPHALEEYFLPGKGLLPCDWHGSGPSGVTVRYPQEYRTWLSRYRYASASTAKTADLRIARPVDGAVFYLDPSAPIDGQEFLVEAFGSGTGSLSMDGVTYWSGAFPAKVWLPLIRGAHIVDASQDDGSLTEIEVETR